MKTKLALPGHLHVVATEPGRALVLLGVSAGWRVPQGIRTWAREISFVQRSDLTPALRETLKATFPEDQVAPARLPLAFRAAEHSKLVAVAPALTAKLIAAGVRVITIGADRISNGFFYFAEGGTEPPVRVQEELITVLLPALADNDSTAAIEKYLLTLVDRLILHLSKGAFDELDVELAAALPKLNTDGSGLADCDMDAFDREARGLEESAKPFGAHPEALATFLRAQAGATAADAPLFGKAEAHTEPALAIALGGEPLKLAEYKQWMVEGEAKLPAVAAQPVDAHRGLAATKVSLVSEVGSSERTPDVRLQPPAAEAAPLAKVAAADPLARTLPEVAAGAASETLPAVLAPSKVGADIAAKAATPAPASVKQPAAQPVAGAKAAVAAKAPTPTPSKVAAVTPAATPAAAKVAAASATSAGSLSGKSPAVPRVEPKIATPKVPVVAAVVAAAPVVALAPAAVVAPVAEAIAPQPVVAVAPVVVAPVAAAAAPSIPPPASEESDGSSDPPSDPAGADENRNSDSGGPKQKSKTKGKAAAKAAKAEAERVAKAAKAVEAAAAKEAAAKDAAKSSEKAGDKAATRPTAKAEVAKTDPKSVPPKAAAAKSAKVAESAAPASDSAALAKPGGGGNTMYIAIAVLLAVAAAAYFLFIKK